MEVPSSQMPSSQMQLPQLPPYEPLNHPLRSEATLSIHKLRKHEGLRYLSESLDRSADLMTECADAINNLVSEREHENRAAARGAEEEDAMASFRDQVDDLTGRMDRSVRKVIDAKQDVVDCDETLQDIHGRVSQLQNLPTTSTQRSRRSGRDSQEADEDISMSCVTAPGASAQPSQEFTPSAYFEQNLRTQRDRYEAQGLRTRYSEQNRYVAFKNAVWVARHPKGETVPHASTWFRDQEGSPAPGTAPAAGGGGGSDDSDDDLQTIRVKLSTKCPLSLMEMRNPISNRQCAHAFEKDTIEKYIKQNGRVRGAGPPGAACPVAGCDKTLGLGDLYSNVALVRNIRRLQESRLREDEVDDEKDGTQPNRDLPGGREYEDIDEDGDED